jgi:NAD-dependent dihydropyrimidine dehydrogenase PreA subunit
VHVIAVKGRHDVVVVHSVTLAGRPPRRLSCDWGFSPAVSELSFGIDTPKASGRRFFSRGDFGVIPGDLWGFSQQNRKISKTLHVVECHGCHSGYIVGVHRRGAVEMLHYLDLNFLYQEATMDFENNDNIGGYAVPVDPMDLLQCDSCQ